LGEQEVGRGKGMWMVTGKLRWVTGMVTVRTKVGVQTMVGQVEEEKMVVMGWMVDGLCRHLPFDMWPVRRFSHGRSVHVCLLAEVYSSGPMQGHFLLRVCRSNPYIFYYLIKYEVKCVSVGMQNLQAYQAHES
jgi:hypothetical protein